MGCTVKEAQARCDAAEFDEWRAYYLIEPWGSKRLERAVGLAVSILAGCQGAKLDPSICVPPTLDDLIREEAEAPQEMQETRARLAAFKRKRAADG